MSVVGRIQELVWEISERPLRRARKTAGALRRGRSVSRWYDPKTLARSVGVKAQVA
jgi:hypothetical protein